MNSDLISRNALIQHAYSAIVDGVEKDIIDLSDVDNAPTVETHISPEVLNQFAKYVAEHERPQGKWIFHKDFHENCRYGCNQCGNLNNIPSNFCPNCGARMKKEDVFTRKEELSKEESEWLIDFITNEDNDEDIQKGGAEE